MHLIRLFQIWKHTTQTVSHENVSQSSTCHAFRWLIPFYINAAFHLLQSGFIGIVYSAIPGSIALMSTLMSERIKKRAMTDIAPLLMR